MDSRLISDNVICCPQPEPKSAHSYSYPGLLDATSGHTTLSQANQPKGHAIYDATSALRCLCESSKTAALNLP